MAAQSDLVSGKLKGKLSAAPGQRFTVYRPSGTRELDENPKALHLQRIGVVEVESELGKAKYRFKILKSGDSVQLGDLLKREG
jgi:hypothetical protein